MFRLGVMVSLRDYARMEVPGVNFHELLLFNGDLDSVDDTTISSLRKRWPPVEFVHVQESVAVGDGKERLGMSFKGIPREEIWWYPVIDPDRCTGCSSCADFCSQGVFKFDGKISHVVKPYACVVGKSSCRSFCPEKAISFPTNAELRVMLRELKEKHGMSD